MNYYEHHLGDYLRDTAHLSMLEDAAYRRLLDRMYSTEQGIPVDQAHRVVRARTKEEQAAVDAVLAEFFTVRDGLYVQQRAMEEIAKFHEGEPDREAKRTNERERQRRARELRQQLFEQVRALGITPRFDATTTELRQHLSRVTGRDVSQVTRRDCGVTQAPVTHADTATQTPYSRLQSPEEVSLREPSDARARLIGSVPEGGRPEDQELRQFGRDAWRDTPGCDTESMQNWIQHRAVKKPPDGLRPHERIAAARMLAGMGTVERQRAAVQMAIANGWHHLRPQDANTATGAKPARSNSTADRIAYTPEA